jgi:oligopeptide transport system substrate-binding protein
MIPVEEGMYLRDLKDNTPDFFRKGLNMDRPTCSAALDAFKTNSKDNYINYHNKHYDLLVQRTEGVSGNREKSKKICGQAIRTLMGEYRLIPQGLIHFSMLDDGKFEGYKINELNQLDLSDLRIKK